MSKNQFGPGVVFNKRHKYMSTKAVDQLYDTLSFVHDTFSELKIKYFMIGGTSIGALRHGGLIPWDDDADLGILSTDLKKLYGREFKAALKREKLEMVTEEELGIIKIFYRNGKRIKGVPWKYPFVDIFVYSKDKAGDYALYNEASKALWPKDKYKVSDLFPLTKYSFGPLQLFGPRNAKRMLERIYGKDVWTHYYEEYDHQKEVQRKKVKRKMQIYDYIPVLPSNTKFASDD